MRRVLRLVLAAAALGATSAAAEPIADKLEIARQAEAKGELLKAVSALQAALEQVHRRLADGLVPLMPPAPAGWQGFDAQAEGLGIAGGGMTVMKGYEKGEASLNASIVIDPEAVAGIAEILANPASLGAQPGMSRIEVNGGQALMRWDAEDKSGEVMMVLGDSVLLQVVGNGIDKADVMVGMMRAWNVSAVRKQVGI